MIDAVLFDWGQTLVQFNWDEDLLVAGHEAGLAALGREAEAESFTARYRTRVLEEAGPHEPYAGLLRELLGELSDEQVDAFVDAEHEAWQPAHEPLGAGQALLEALRSRGIKTALVANSWPDPARVLRGDVERHGLTALFDAIVFSEEVGVSKPAPEIFLRALDLLDVQPERAMFVGDSLAADVQGAANLGMTTVQALWFRADDIPALTEPDFMAFTPMDVLNAVRRLAP